MNEQEFGAIMAYLSSAYPDVEIKKDTAKVYYDLLGHLPAATLQQSVRLHIAKHKWFPKVAELLQAIAPTMRPPREAWQALLEAAETGSKPDMDEATAAGLAAVGGWEQFQFTEYKDLEFRFRDFKEAYQSTAEKFAERIALPGSSRKQIEGGNG